MAKNVVHQKEGSKEQIDRFSASQTNRFLIQVSVPGTQVLSSKKSYHRGMHGAFVRDEKDPFSSVDFLDPQLHRVSPRP
jgi:hypothetical protein